ncbi:MAG: hypothetical protein Q7T08_11280, partial [Devosia sp.]|nr:hypothetical protein [Devosia sp.]
MFTARGTPRAVLAGAFVAALAIAVSLSLPAAPATDGIDEIITGAINPAPVPVQAAPPAGSAEFLGALELLSAQKHADAYEAARELPSDVERRTIQWGAIYYGNGAIDADAVQRFSADAPDFATPAVFRTRIEQALIKADASGPTLIKLLGGAMPATLDAQIAVAGA